MFSGCFSDFSTSVRWAICVLTTAYLVGACYTWQRDTCNLGCQRRNKAASSAVLFSASTKAAVLSVVQQLPFPTHSAQGQGRINTWLCCFLLCFFFSLRGTKEIRVLVYISGYQMEIWVYFRTTLHVILSSPALAGCGTVEEIDWGGVRNSIIT